MIAVLEKPSLQGPSKRASLMSDFESEPLPWSALPPQVQRDILYRLWVKVALALYSRWTELAADTDLFWNPGFVVDGFTLLHFDLYFDDLTLNNSLKATNNWLSLQESFDEQTLYEAARVGSEAFLEGIQLDQLSLEEVEEALGLKTYAGMMEEASSKLSENQRRILLAIFRKSIEVGIAQPVKWLASAEFPDISLPSISRSLKELEDRKLVTRLPKKQVQITALGWQVAKNLNLFR